MGLLDRTLPGTSLILPPHELRRPEAENSKVQPAFELILHVTGTPVTYLDRILRYPATVGMKMPMPRRIEAAVTRLQSA
jgi:hypothetical protein